MSAKGWFSCYQFFLRLLIEPVAQELNRRSVTERGVLPFPFVERLDVLEAGGLHVAMGGVANSMHPLVLEAVVPTFSRCVVGTSPEISSAKG